MRILGIPTLSLTIEIEEISKSWFESVRNDDGRNNSGGCRATCVVYLQYCGEREAVSCGGAYADDFVTGNMWGVFLCFGLG